jgi:membrane protease YdiL (CAAX protease family)
VASGLRRRRGVAWTPLVSPPTRSLPVPLALALYGGMLVLAWAWRAGLYDESLWYASEAAQRAGPHWGRDLALGVALAGCVALASSWSERRTRWGRRLAEELAGALGPLSPAACLALAAASGVAEEALFRGALQPRVGLVMASLLFGLSHVPATRALRPWTALAVVLGLGLGVLFEATGSLAAPVAAHVGVNVVGLLSLSRRAALAGY